MRSILLLCSIFGIVGASAEPLTGIDFELKPNAYFLVCQVVEGSKLAASTRIYRHNDNPESMAIKVEFDKLGEGKLPFRFTPKGEKLGDISGASDVFTFEVGGGSKLRFSQIPTAHSQLKTGVEGVSSYQLSTISEEKVTHFYLFFSDDKDAIAKVFTPILGQGYIKAPFSAKWRGAIKKNR